MLSLNSYSSSNLNIIDDMTCEEKAPDKYKPNISEQSESLFYLERSISSNEIDNPSKEKEFSGKYCFEAMKHEINHLNSCTKLPSCPFLLLSKFGIVPIIQPRFMSTEGGSSEINSSTCNPRYPRMAYLELRLVSYKDCPCTMAISKQLAECGLFYAGPIEDVGDVVTCFYCGGSFANWDYNNDDPWAKHTSHFPDCGYLTLVRRHGGMQCQLTTTNLPPIPQSIVTQLPSMHQHQLGTNLSTSLEDEIIFEASTIFGKPLVLQVVAHHLKESSHHFTSGRELIHAIYQYNRERAPRVVSCDVTGIWKTSRARKILRKQAKLQHQSGPNLSTSLEDEIISEASTIFDKSLVLKVVAQHLKESSHHFTSCRKLIKAIYKYKKEHAPRESCDETGVSKRKKTLKIVRKQAMLQHQSGPNLSTSFEDDIISEARIYQYNRERSPRVSSGDETGI